LIVAIEMRQRRITSARDKKQSSIGFIPIVVYESLNIGSSRATHLFEHLNSIVCFRRYSLDK